MAFPFFGGALIWAVGGAVSGSVIGLAAIVPLVIGTRLLRVRIAADSKGLRAHNILRSYRVRWSDVVEIRVEGDVRRPLSIGRWRRAVVDLHDGRSIPLAATLRSDFAGSGTEKELDTVVDSLWRLREANLAS